MRPQTILSHKSHRPWPVPSTPWVIEQSWVDVLFAHYPLPLETVRARVPAALDLDTFDGRAWVSIAAFRIDSFRTRGIPWETRFPELNLRTYVKLDNKPGVYFFSLDAAHNSAVVAARTLFRLNYYHASIRIVENAMIEFTSRRLEPPRADFRAHYRAAGAPLANLADSLDNWLVERYCLYAVRGRGRVFRVDIHHLPWVLQPAQAELSPGGLFTAAGLTPPEAPPLLHFSARQDTLTWGPAPVARPL
jgi:uncharacterized protein YqjF (DUF2071 family)